MRFSFTGFELTSIFRTKLKLTTRTKQEEVAYLRGVDGPVIVVGGGGGGERGGVGF